MPFERNHAAGNGNPGQVAERRRTMSEEAKRTLKEIANGFARPLRAPILQTPADLGLGFEDVTFPSADGVPIEAWFIPRGGSNKLVICNHPLNFNRYGCPTDREPFLALGDWGGNNFETNYMEDYRILHEAGYNVLTYDERNMGRSGTGNGLTSAGRFESRDVIGSLRYARQRDELKHMAVGLFSRCNGANATLFAMSTRPEPFRDVRCLVACQPLSVRAIMGRALEHAGLPDRTDELEAACRLQVGFSFDELSPVPWAAKAVVPTFVYQVRDDRMTYPGDVQAIYDRIPTEKQLHWIEGTSARWDGYLEFQRRPQPMLAWFEKYLP